MENTHQVELNTPNLIFLENFSPVMLQCEEAVIFVKPIDLDTVKNLVQNRIVKSYIGRRVTVTALARLLAMPIGVYNLTPKLAGGEYLVFMLNTPLPGHYIIKSRQELEKYGYSFYYLKIKC